MVAVVIVVPDLDSLGCKLRYVGTGTRCEWKERKGSIYTLDVNSSLWRCRTRAARDVSVESENTRTGAILEPDYRDPEFTSAMIAPRLSKRPRKLHRSSLFNDNGPSMSHVYVNRRRKNRRGTTSLRRRSSCTLRSITTL